MWPAFLASDYYDPSVPSRQHRSATDLPANQQTAGWVGDRRNGSHVHLEPLNGLGAQLCPCSFATATPQAFTVASRSATSTDRRVSRASPRGYALQPSPYPSGFEPVVLSLEAFMRWFTVVTPSRPRSPGTRSSDSTDPPRFCKGRLPSFPSSLGSDCPQLLWTRCDGPMAVSFHHDAVQGASWRTMSHDQTWLGAVARSSGFL